jgi:S-adenosylmethionine:tRNA ribosyltransferase-isomerase
MSRLSVSDFDYRLPPHLIAQRPVEPRDHARLLVLHRRTGTIEHRRFYDLPAYLQAGDLLLLNETRVIPARLLGRKDGPGGARVEVLLVRPLERENEWEAMVRPSRRLPIGAAVVLDSPSEGLRATVHERMQGDGTTRRVVLPSGLRLEEAGQVPLPPYITEPLEDPERYQTVYARQPGSVAAPTAGLHFTAELLTSLEGQGVRIARLVLTVGPGTFRPVKVEDPKDHDLGREAYLFPQDAADAVRETKAHGGRVACVGTTSVRTLETVARDQGADSAQPQSLERLHAESGWTDLFILPGFRYSLTDVLVTNFHLPRSTLLMLVAAFAGKDLIDRAYAEAIAEEYRFYSFGDAMLIL